MLQHMADWDSVVSSFYKLAFAKKWFSSSVTKPTGPGERVVGLTDTMVSRVIDPRARRGGCDPLALPLA